MKEKLIKLSEAHYIVISDDATLKDEWCIELWNGESKSSSSPYIDKNGNKWWLRKMNMNCGNNDPKCKKITHSTEPLEEIPNDYGRKWYNQINHISLSEVQEAIGYNVEEMAEIHVESMWGVYKNDVLEHQDIISDQTLGALTATDFKAGFKAHQELVKDKLFTVDDMEAAFEAGEATTIHRIVQGRNDYITFDKFILPLLSKTEWDIEFVNGKIKLTNDG